MKFINDQVLVIVGFVVSAALYFMWYRGFWKKRYIENMDGTMNSTVNTSTSISGSISNELEHYKLLSKYLTLILRKKDAQDELFKLEQGYARVYHSPRLDKINRQIYSFQKMIKKEPNTLKFFEENLDLTI